MTANENTSVLPQAFVWRRLHSLTGLWLTIYLIFHLFTNAQAGLYGSGYIRSVNSIQELPFLPLLEIAILAVPILIHMIWGIKYVLTAKYNSFGLTGHAPYLPEYARNHRYTWQRITSWLLILGIVGHVVHMRFIQHPISVHKGYEQLYMLRVNDDPGLVPLANRLGASLYDATQLEQLKQQTQSEPGNKWVEALQARPLKGQERLAVANNFGTIELLMVRDTFKMPLMLLLYTLFVLAACYHGFNGLWTFMISWGVTLSARAQKLMSGLSIFLMILVGLLGLSAIWLTYWVNLK